MPHWPPHTALSICCLHYKELQTLQEPNILFPNSSLVPHGPRDLGKAGTGCWFCQQSGPEGDPQPLPSTRATSQGILELPVLMAALLGAKQMLRVVRKSCIKALKCTGLCFGNGEGDSALCWHSLQAGSGTDWFGFNYFYSSLGGCCTIYCGLGKTHAPSLEGKMAIAAF